MAFSPYEVVLVVASPYLLPLLLLPTSFSLWFPLYAEAGSSSFQCVPSKVASVPIEFQSDRPGYHLEVQGASPCF